MAEAPFVIVDNPAQQRYELSMDGEVAFLDYRRRDGHVILVHTEVPEPLRGAGIGARLARHALDEARRLGVGVVVRCPFVTSWLRRHPEYNEIVVARVAEDPR